MKTPPAFLGAWRITETEVWDKDALDMVVPAHMTLKQNGLGNFKMIAVQGEIDARFEDNRVEFSWVPARMWNDARQLAEATIVDAYYFLTNDSDLIARSARLQSATLATRPSELPFLRAALDEILRNGG